MQRNDIAKLVNQVSKILDGTETAQGKQLKKLLETMHNSPANLFNANFNIINTILKMTVKSSFCQFSDDVRKVIAGAVANFIGINTQIVINLALDRAKKPSDVYSPDVIDNYCRLMREIVQRVMMGETNKYQTLETFSTSETVYEPLQMASQGCQRPYGKA